MRKYLGFLVVLLSSLALAQNTRVDGTAFSRSGLPAPGAFVSICSQPAITAISEVGNTVTVTSSLAVAQGNTVQIFDVTPSAYNGNWTVVTTGSGTYTFTHTQTGLGVGTSFGANVITGTTAAPTGPCAPLVNVCAAPVDATCAVPNPVTADGLGNYFFYLPSGLYTYEIFGSVLTTRVLPDQNVNSAVTGSGTVNPCGGNNCDAFYPTANIPSIFGDILATDDGSGNKAAKSYKFTDPNHSGFWNEDSGPALPTLADLNGVYFSIKPNATFSTYGFEPWDTKPTPGDCIDLAAGDAANWVKLHDSGNPCGIGGGGGGTLLNPVAPTLTNQNAAGARSITYGVQMCEDGPACTKTSTLVTATISNANASPQVLLSAFADTLYGYRCANIYVTSDSGARTGVPGLIASCVWKKYIDTGANGNGVAATNTNTTATIATMNPTSGGCNYPSGSPQGIDGLPCAPNAADYEASDTDAGGSPGDANNPFFTRVNFGTTSATLSNGYLILTPQTVNGLRMLTEATPGASTPWAFVTAMNMNATLNSVNQFCGLGLYDGTKVELLVMNHSASTPFWLMRVEQWTSPTLFSANAFSSPTGGADIVGGWIYFKIQNDGVNINWSYSYDGANYNTPVYSEAKAAFLANTNNVALLCEADSGTPPAATFDYLRRVQ